MHRERCTARWSLRRRSLGTMIGWAALLAAAFVTVVQAADAVDLWSLKPLSPPAPPEVKRPAWCAGPIDRFILARLEAEGCQPAPPLARDRLIRRVYFDLWGLPPSPEEVRAFVADASPDAYERLIDRLLASPHYGERWARYWLDLVRFAETNGYERDARKAERLAVPRLGDPRAQRRQALRPVRARATGRRRAARRQRRDARSPPASCAWARSTTSRTIRSSTSTSSSTT